MSTAAEAPHHEQDDILAKEAAGDEVLAGLIAEREARLDDMAQTSYPPESEDADKLREVMMAVEARKQELGLLPPQE